MRRALALDANGNLTWAKHAKGTRRKPGEMNKTEAAYAGYLETRKQVGEVEWYGYEAMTFKLGHDTRYTPDFVVMLADGTLEGHEVKGKTTVKRSDGTRKPAPYFQDDAKVKVNVAARMFPLRFCVAFPLNGGWNVTEVKA